LKPGDIAKAVPGAGMICGVGYVGGMRAMIVVDDAAIDAGAAQPMMREKFQRCQDIALRERLPFVHLIESAGANLLNYEVEGFVSGGRNFYNLCRLSAAGLPVMGVVHGASTAGGAYMTGLSDYVVMVRGNARAFLAGPPLLKAATGEIADAEELGGADMHARVSGLAEYLAEDDSEGVAIMRELCGLIAWDRENDKPPTGAAPLYDEEELLGIMPPDLRKPVDMREIIARIVDASEFLEFKALYGPGTVCGHARLCGMEIGVLTNNGPIDADGAAKATHFIQACSQARTPLVYLQNTTGYLVGKESERAGIIKHGSKMIQAVANAGVPQITILCGSSFGAVNYGMCGRGFNPNFIFSWPTAKTGVMGAAQAAGTMRVVAEQGAAARNEKVDVAALEDTERKIRAADLGHLHLRALARRWGDRSARYAPRDRLHAVDLQGGQRAHAAPRVLRGRARLGASQRVDLFLQSLHEAAGVSAVDDAMIVAQRHRQTLTPNDLVIRTARRLLHQAGDAENGDLRAVDDRCEARAAEIAKRAQRKPAA
jgi:geranyl-CoA carboxylase beta subunit